VDFRKRPDLKPPRMALRGGFIPFERPSSSAPDLVALGTDPSVIVYAALDSRLPTTEARCHNLLLPQP